VALVLVAAELCLILGASEGGNAEVKDSGLSLEVAEVYEHMVSHAKR
jgi:hypothetical protein